MCRSLGGDELDMLWARRADPLTMDIVHWANTVITVNLWATRDKFTCPWDQEESLIADKDRHEFETLVAQLMIANTMSDRDVAARPDHDGITCELSIDIIMVQESPCAQGNIDAKQLSRVVCYCAAKCAELRPQALEVGQHVMVGDVD